MPSSTFKRSEQRTTQHTHAENTRHGKMVFDKVLGSMQDKQRDTQRKIQAVLEAYPHWIPYSHLTCHFRTQVHLHKLKLEPHNTADEDSIYPKGGQAGLRKWLFYDSRLIVLQLDSILQKGISSWYTFCNCYHLWVSSVTNIALSSQDDTTTSCHRVTPFLPRQKIESPLVGIKGLSAWQC